MYAKILCIPTVYPFYVNLIQVHFYVNTINILLKKTNFSLIIAN